MKGILHTDLWLLYIHTEKGKKGREAKGEGEKGRGRRGEGSHFSMRDYMYLPDLGLLQCMI